MSDSERLLKLYSKIEKYRDNAIIEERYAQQDSLIKFCNELIEIIEN